MLDKYSWGHVALVEEVEADPDNIMSVAFGEVSDGTNETGAHVA